MTRVTKQFTDVMDGVNNLIKAIKADYCIGQVMMVLRQRQM